MPKANDNIWEADLDVEAALQALRELLKKLPGPVRKKVEESVDELEELLKDARPPRLAVIGRRGSGKSSLINALYGRPVTATSSVVAGTGDTSWTTITHQGRTLELLDTRGAQEGSRPQEGVSDDQAIDSFKRAMGSKQPDAILFLCKAKEVDAAIDADITFVREVCKLVRSDDKTSVPVVGVASQCDELDPPDIRIPSEDAEKLEHTRTACHLLRDKLMGLQDVAEVVEVVAVSAFVAFDDRGAVVPTRDYRWQIDALAELLIERLPKCAQLQFARVARIRAVQRKIATSLTVVVSGAAALLAASPVPFADLPALLGMQVLLVTAIAYVAGRELDGKTAKQFIKSLGLVGGGGFLAREAVRGLLKLLPAGGSLISGTIAGAVTYGLGAAATAFFIEGATIEQAREAGRRGASEAKTSLEKSDQERLDLWQRDAVAGE